MNKILIALDYDPTAQKVAESGYALAKAMGAEIILQHVILEPIYYSSPDYSPVMGYVGIGTADLLEMANSEKLENASMEFLTKTREHLGDKTIHLVVSGGDTAESILKTAKEFGVDIIVLGTHSRRWLDKILMGSVAEKVLHQSTVPLFIIPTKEDKD